MAAEQDTSGRASGGSGGTSRGVNVSISRWGCRRQRTACARKRADAPWHDAVASLHAARPRAGANPVADYPPMNPDAKLQAFLSGTGLQLPNQSAAPHPQPQPDPFAWQLQFAQMQAAQMHAAAQAAKFQGMYAGLFSGSTGQAQPLQGQGPWASGGALPWAAPAAMPWANVQAQVAAAAQAAAAANPSATATLAQQAATWAAAQMAASLPGGATAMPATSLPVTNNPTGLLNPLQAMQMAAQSPSSNPNVSAAAQVASAGAPPLAADRHAHECGAPAPSASNPPSLLQSGLESAAVAASSVLPDSSTAPVSEHRQNLQGIADAAAAAAAEYTPSLSDAETEPACATEATQPSTAELAAHVTASTSCERDARTANESATPHLQLPWSTAAAAVSPVEPQPDNTAPAHAAAVDMSTHAADQAAPDSAAETGVPHSENARPGDTANTRNEVIQVGHKRSRGHMAGSCTEEDSSDEATIAIKDTGSHIHGILPGVHLFSGCQRA